jgi:hypothetical protein
LLPLFGLAWGARLQRPDGRPFLELHNAIGTRRLSMAIGSTFTRTPLKILTAEAVTEPRPHER